MEAESCTLKAGALLVSGKRNYKVVCVLGSGGFGVTYLAKGHVKVDNVMVEGLFAVKEMFPRDFSRRVGPAVVPDPDKTADFAKCKDDFILEATRLQKIGTLHDNIVKVNEIFEANGTAYYVMQHVNGESLLDYVAKYGALDPDFAVNLLIPILSAVEFLHDNRINHFDIKPDNIMLQGVDDGIMPVLIDFGLSIHYKKGGGKTTPRSFLGLSEGYAPVEQYAEIDHFSPQTDVYALAATLCYMLTGEAPSPAPALKLQQLRERLLQVAPGHMADAICRAMDKTEETRTPSVSRFRQELAGEILEVEPDNGPDLEKGRIGGNLWGNDRRGVDAVSHGQRKKSLMWILAGIAAGAIVAGMFVLMKILPGQEDSQGEPEVTLETTEVAVEQTETPSVQSVQTEPSVADAPQQVQQQTSSASSSSSVSSTSDTPSSPPQSQVTTGSVSVGNGTYSGKLRGGKPHGKGRVVYHAEGRVAPTVSDIAYPGYTLEGYWTDGLLESGQLYDESGRKIKTIIP